MTIRPITTDDLPALLEMGREFHRFARSAERGLGYNEDDVAGTLGALSSADFVRVADVGGEPVGVVAAVAVPWPCNHADVMVQEVWLWAHYNAPAGTGQALVDAMTEWGREKEARCVMLGQHLTGDLRRDVAMARMYRRMGFRPVETNHALVLS